MTKAEIIMLLMRALMTVLKPEYLKRMADFLIDLAEEAVNKSENKVDDMIVLPLCELVRKTFDIPDED